MHALGSKATATPENGLASHSLHEKGNYEWLYSRAASAEASGCLTFSDQFAQMSPDQIGTTVEYTVREKLRLPGIANLSFVPLSPTFKYKVEGVFGGVRGCDKGRAMLLRPLHEIHTLYVAFRSVRAPGNTPSEDVGPSSDRENFKRSEPTHAQWLPHGSWRVHAGVLDHDDSLWESGFPDFLLEFLYKHKAITQVIFVGTSLAGALAEMSAMRLVLEFPKLDAKIHVLTFGSVPWADRTVGDHFDYIFGRRSVGMALSLRRRAPTPSSQRAWWVCEPQSPWELMRQLVFPQTQSRGSSMDATNDERLTGR